VVRSKEAKSYVIDRDTTWTALLESLRAPLKLGTHDLAYLVESAVLQKSKRQILNSQKVIFCPVLIERLHF
jgi:hypothetical protein